MEAGKCIPTLSTAAAKSVLTINDLNDDSLGIIFNKLSYRDRVGIESVCKRWRDVSEANWCSYSKHLIIRKDTFPSLRGNTPEEAKNILEKILQRRGRYLEEISFLGHLDFNHYYDFEVGTIKHIVECCPRLKHLTTGMINLNDEDWFACSNLKTLSITNDYGELRELFRINKRLRRLEMIDTASEANIFDHLDPGQLEILHLQDETFEFTARSADKLAESLVELNYGSYSDMTLHLQHLSKLKNLRTLTLSFQKVDRRNWIIDTQFMVDIAKNCQKLEHLTLNFLYLPCTQNFIPLLFNLPCLKSLVLILNKYQMPYEELDRLFREAPNLKFFVLSSCKKCKYQEDNVKLCNNHSQSGVKHMNSVASKSNEAVIMTRTGCFSSPQVEFLTYKKLGYEKRSNIQWSFIKNMGIKDIDFF